MVALDKLNTKKSEDSRKTWTKLNTKKQKIVAAKEISGQN